MVGRSSPSAMTKNQQAIKLLHWIADGCRASAVVLTDLAVSYAQRAGGPHRVGLTVAGVSGGRGIRDDVRLEELEFWIRRFQSGARRVLLVDKVPRTGIGPADKRTLFITYD
jgi:hypothetical protein